MITDNSRTRWIYFQSNQRSLWFLKVFFVSRLKTANRAQQIFSLFFLYVCPSLCLCYRYSLCLSVCLSSICLLVSVCLSVSLFLFLISFLFFSTFSTFLILLAAVSKQHTKVSTHEGWWKRKLSPPTKQISIKSPKSRKIKMLSVVILCPFLYLLRWPHTHIKNRLSERLGNQFSLARCNTNFKNCFTWNDPT